MRSRRAPGIFTGVKKMVDDDTSFALLRANPKLTGNIKVVVDSDSNMYLDTFKVSLGLSQNKYRHIPINPSEYYGRTIMSKMKDMPVDDLYMVENSCYNLFAMADDYNDQYYDKYNYGVRTNFDRLYKENFALLAPLCIRKTLPDFFVIFRFKNHDEFSENGVSIDILNYNNVDIVKVFDLREGTNVGDYIRNILNNNSKFVGDLYTGYSYDHFNGYNGISLDRGVVSCVYESTVDERMFNSQVAMNNWYTLGFQRNHMVSKDILNFEFMFNDNTQKLFSTNTYFGLYIRINGEDNDFSCIGYNTSSGKNEFNVSPKGEGFNPSSYPNIIYGISTPDTFIRLKDNIYTSEVIRENFCRKPIRGLITAETINVKNYLNGFNRCHYVSFSLGNTLNIGEHFKIIDKTADSDGKRNMYEVVIRGGTYESEFSEISEEEIVYNGLVYINHRIFINNIKNRDLIPQNNKVTEIINQARLLERAFNIFLTDKIRSYSDNDGCVSILYGNCDGESSDLIFVWNSEPYPSDDKNSIIKPKMFGFNDGITDHLITIDPSDNSYDNLKIYFPTGFEYLGSRYMYGVMFINISSMSPDYSRKPGDDYLSRYIINKSLTNQIKSSESVLYKIDDTHNSVYYSSLYPKISILSSSVTGISIDTENSNPCIVGFGPIDGYYINLSESPIDDRNIQFLENTPINAGVCSIFNIKDYYKDVIDNKSIFGIKEVNGEYVVVQDSIPSSTPGEYATNNTAIDENSREIAITNNPYKPEENVPEEYLHNYIDMYDTLDCSTNGDGSFSLLTKDSLAIYLLNLQNNAHYNMDISLIEPYCCKWRCLSSDSYGMRMRPMLSLMDVGYKTMVKKPYLIKDEYYYIDSSSYFIPKNEDIVGFRLNGHVNSFITDTPSIESIIGSDNLSIEDTLYDNSHYYRNKFSKVYLYGNNEIEFVSAGVKIRLSSNNKSFINLSKYVGYSSIFKAFLSANERILVFVDETTDQLEVIAYTSNPSLSNISSDSMKNTVSATIKTKPRESHDVTFNNGLRIDFIQPYEIHREDTAYRETTVGSVHPTYSVPVMIDMLDFDRTYDFDSLFGKNFDYSNLKISSIKDINQTWLQKVPDINNVIQQGSGVKHEQQTYIDYVEYSATQKSDSGITTDLVNNYYWVSLNNELSNPSYKVKILSQTITEKVVDFKNSLFWCRLLYDIGSYNLFHNETNVWQSNKHIIYKDIFEYVEEPQSIFQEFKLTEFRDNLNSKTDEQISYLEDFSLRMSRLYGTVYNPKTSVPHGRSIHMYRIDPDGWEDASKIGEYFVDVFETVTDYATSISLQADSDFTRDGYSTYLILAYTEPKDIEWFTPERYQEFLNESVFRCEQNNLKFADATNINDTNAISEYYKFRITYTSIKQIAKKAKLSFSPENVLSQIPGFGKGYSSKEKSEEVFSFENCVKTAEEKKTVNYSIVLLNSTSSLTLYKNMSIVKGYWHQEMCRLFKKYDEYEKYYGYISGYEKNCYIASRGITRYGSDNKSNIIILDNWKDSIIIIDDNLRSVTIDLTSALFEKIKSFDGFNETWNKFISSSSTSFSDAGSYKDKYIENAIARNITINDNNLFKVYVNTNITSFDFLNEKPSNYRQFEEVKNLNNTLYFENNRYYMKINGLDPYNYYAEFYIEL